MDIIRSLLNEFGQCLKGTFLFVIFVEIFLCVFSRCQSRIKRNGNLFVRIIIKSSKFPGIRSQVITVGMDELPVDFVFFTILGITQLLFLQLVFFAIALQSSLNDMAKIGAFLPDTGECVLCCIIGI